MEQPIENSNLQPNRMQIISETLSEARKAAQALPGFPGPMPTSFPDAYAVQGLSRVNWPDQVIGWKVGGVPAAFIEEFGETRLVGPSFARNLRRASGDAPTQMPVFAGGFAAIEPELIIQLGARREEDRMFIGAEIASSVLPAINDIGPIAVICDFGNNNGIILGEEITDWRQREGGSLMVETYIDGELIASRKQEDLRLNAQAALEFLLDHGAKYSIEMPEGTCIATGAITGVHEAAIGAHSTLDFGQFGKLDLELIAARKFQ